MTQTGFKLTFPDGKVFECTEQVKVQYDTEDNPLSGGFQQLAALLTDFLDEGGTSGRFDSGRQSIQVSFGAGIHRVDLTLKGASGNTGANWGGAPSDASARTKVEYFDRAVQINDVDSRNPVVYEGGEFSTSGDFDPIDVGIESASLSPDSPDDSASTFSGQIRLLDIVAFQQTIDNALEPTDK